MEVPVLRRTVRPSLLAVAVAGLALLSACGSSSGSNSSSGLTTGTSSAGSPSLMVANSSFGNILMDPSGRTLYLLTADGSKLACTGGCLSVWQPVSVPKGSMPVAGNGVTGSLGVVSRGSNDQVTIAGHPLYTYTGDTSSGQTTGQGISDFGGTWYVVSPAGAAVTSSGGTGATPPAGSSSSNPYNY
jgi:predicted lipoprotein with Yx(FWY)xxD motif